MALIACDLIDPLLDPVVEVIPIPMGITSTTLPGDVEVMGEVDGVAIPMGIVTTSLPGDVEVMGEVDGVAIPLGIVTVVLEGTR